MEKTVKNVMEGKLTASGLKIGVVCARFNAFFVEKLLEGAVDAFVRHGGNADDLAVAWVPGSYELPFVCSKMAKSGIQSPSLCDANGINRELSSSALLRTTNIT